MPWDWTLVSFPGFISWSLFGTVGEFMLQWQVSSWQAVSLPSHSVRLLTWMNFLLFYVSVEEQVVSRAHRMGASQPITVETLAMRGTIEEQMIAIKVNTLTFHLLTGYVDHRSSYLNCLLFLILFKL